MGRLHPVQYAFNGGELSPLMDMRHDMDQRRLGVRYLENFFVHLQGPVETSPGFQYVEDSPGTVGRIFPFYVSTYIGYIVLVTPEYVYVTDRDGFINKDELVTNGDFLDGGDNWTVDAPGTSEVTFSGGACFLVPGGGVGQHAQIEQNMTGLIADDPHNISMVIASGAGTGYLWVGTTQGGNDLLDLTYTGTTTISAAFVPSGTTVWVTAGAPEGEPQKVIDKISCYNASAEPEVIQFPSPWTTIDEIFSIQTKMAPGTLDLWMVSLTVTPYILSYDKVNRDWDFQEKVFTNPPAEWTGTNYPGVIEFFEGRVYLGGTPNEPEDFWASRPGDNPEPPEPPDPPPPYWAKYTDFLLKDEDAEGNAVANPDNAIHFTIERRGQIRWMKGSKNMVIGTEHAEHILTSEGGVIIPGDIQAQLQSTYGSIAGPARAVGNDILFVTPDGRKIRSMGYEWTKEAWTSRDLTFPAEHMTSEEVRIAQLHYAANPLSLIYAVTEDGDIIGAAYDAVNRQAGFFRRTTHGPIKSSCILPYAGRDEIWALIDRDEEGPDLSLERVPGDEQIKLDSWIRLTSEDPTTDWIAAHLNGMECQVIADGALHPNVTPDASTGAFQTQRAVSEVFVGLQFISKMETLNQDYQMYVERRSTSSLPAKQRWNKIFVRLLDSWRPKINGTRAPTRRATTSMDTMEPARTENVQVTNLGWEDEATITIEQDLPLKTVVAGLFGEAKQKA